MTSREIIMANLAHRGPRPGLTFSGGRINDFVSGGPGLPSGYTQRRWVDGEFEFYDDMWGNLWHRSVNGCKGGEIFEPALKDWSQLDHLPLPSYDLEAAAGCMRKDFAAADGKYRLAGIPGWIFASSRYLRKMEIYFMDMLLYPEELKKLHGKLAGIFEKLILAAGKAGADGIFFAEDMGTQKGLLFSPQLWEEYFREIYTRLFGIAHENGLKVFMHSCGQNRAILEPLLQAGVDCFQFDQPAVYDMADLAALLTRYNAVLWSPVDIQKILPTGDKDIIKAGIDDMFRHFEGFLIFKNYGDLNGIGVKEEWDQFAYEEILRHIPQNCL